MEIKGKALLLTIVLICFYVGAFILTVMRCYSRMVIKRAFGIDDIFSVAAQIVFTVELAVVLIGVQNGIGAHVSQLSIATFSEGIKYFFLGELIYVIATGLIKISFSLTLLRIARDRLQIVAIYFVIFLTTVFTGFYFFLILFTCRPVNYFWERVLPEATAGGTCSDPSRMVLATYVHGVVICTGDLILAILPVAMLWSLQMKRRLKISVGALLIMGSIASVATLARIPYVRHLGGTDFLYDNCDIATWSMIEVGVSIMATSAATLRPLMEKLKIMSGFSASRSGDNRNALRTYSRSWYNNNNLQSRNTGLYQQQYSEAGHALGNMPNGGKSEWLSKKPSTLDLETNLATITTAVYGSRSVVSPSDSEENIWDTKTGRFSRSGSEGRSDGGKTMVEGEALETPKGKIRMCTEISTTTTSEKKDGENGDNGRKGLDVHPRGR